MRYTNAKVRFNNGLGALLCESCNKIIATGTVHEDKKHFCYDCKGYLMAQEYEAYQVIQIEDFYKLFIVRRPDSQWRMNSGITNVIKENGSFYFHGESGSVYKVPVVVDAYHKGDLYTSSIINDLVSRNMCSVVDYCDFSKMEF